MTRYQAKRATNFFVIFAMLVSIAAGVSAPAFGQVSGATLSGTVTDSSGAAVPNAEITITDMGKQTSRIVNTDSDGFYTAPNLVPGTFQVKAAAPGFSTRVQAGIQLTVGAKQVLNMTMQVGQVTETVQVTAEAPQVELTSSAVGAVLNSTTAVELPLNGRDWTALAALQPGVGNITNLQQAIGTTTTRATRGFGAQLSVAGTRPQLNNYRIDGISVIDSTGGAPGSVLGVALGVDAIGEFSVLTSNYSAEYGRTAGGVVNAITKSGTNSFHGTAYWFLRDEGFDARAFTDTTLPPFHRNQFGGSAGGPIQKNKMFFFADYEGFRQDLGLSNQNTTLSDPARNGILNFTTAQSFPTGCISTGVTTATTHQCAVTVDPKIKPYLPFFPEPNGGLTASGLGNTGIYNLVSNTVFKEDYVTVRIDRHISDKDSLFGTYTYDNGTTEAPTPLSLWVSGNTSRRNFVALEETHVISAALVNSLRFGFNRVLPLAGAGIAVLNPLAADKSLASFPGLYAPNCCGAATGLTGFTGFQGNTTLLYAWNSFQVYDDAFLTKGAHSLKFGFVAERMQNNIKYIQLPNGSWTFPSLTAFLQNIPTQFQGASPTFRGEIGIRQTIFGGYIQDDWRLRKNLTLNLGLRYEMATVPTEVANKLSNVRNLSDTSPTLGAPFFNNPTTKNFAPRIGLAWDPFGNGKTSIRAAFGMFDILPLNYLFFYGEGHAAPFINSVTATSVLKQGDFPIGSATFTPSAAAVNASLLQYNHVDFNPPRSYMMIWNLNIQRELTPSTSATIGYVGSHGVHNVDRAEEFNNVHGTQTQYGLLWPTTQAPVPNPALGQTVGDFWGGSSVYDALTVQVTKRMSHGFQVGGSYTWSKSFDEGSSATISDNFTNSLINMHYYCNACRHALSDFDIRKILVVNYIWDLPTPKVGGAIVSHVAGGWEVGGIISAISGSPFTPTIGGDPLGLSGASPLDFPSYSGAPGCDTLINPRNPQNYIKLNCFALPSAPALTLAGQCVAFTTVANTCRNLEGNVGRNSLTGPGRLTWDLSLFKNNYISRISETFNAQFRAEMFNVLNRRNFALPGNGSANAGVPVLYGADGSPVTGAGQTLSTPSTTARQIQFALKIIW